MKNITIVVLALLLLLQAPVAARAQSDTARYKLTFDATWDANTKHPHPNGDDAFPATAHFSSLVGAVHGEGVRFWTSGQNASPGMESMAETGATSALEQEVQSAIASNTALSVLSGPAVFPSPGSVMIPEIQVSLTYSQVTLVAMIAPSPDWFVGVSALSLLENGDWVQSKQVTLHAYDAGTEEGDSFSLANPDTVPAQPIQSLSEHALGTFTFTQLGDLTHRVYIPLLSR